MQPESSGTGDREILASRPDLLAAGATIIAIFATSMAAFELSWGRSALGDLGAQPGGFPGAVGVVAVTAVAHEFLHALGWKVFGQLPPGSISIQSTWRVMGLVARLDVPVPPLTYRAGLLMPALVLGMVVVAAGLAIGHGLPVVWAQFFLLESFTDIASLVALRSLPKGALIRSHPRKLGCMAVGGEPPAKA